jgi:hypothetical protein
MKPQIDILLDTDQSNDVVGIVGLTVSSENNCVPPDRAN